MAYGNEALPPIHPITNAAAANQSDTVDLTNGPCRCLYVGVAGDVRILTLGDEDVTLGNLAAGMVHPIGARRVFVSDTSATGIIALY
ncbi:MAG: spike base protein, RCAP_Rcc01079 family [Solirubrobacterales bacterium]